MHFAGELEVRLFRLLTNRTLFKILWQWRWHCNQVQQGRLKTITNKSDHYNSEPVQVLLQLRFLQEHGVDLCNVAFKWMNNKCDIAKLPTSLCENAQVKYSKHSFFCG